MIYTTLYPFYYKAVKETKKVQSCLQGRCLLTARPVNMFTVRQSLVDPSF